MATGSILDSKITHRKCVLSKNLDEIHAGLETSIILTCYGHSKFVCLIMMKYNKTATTVSQLLFTKHTMQIMKTEFCELVSSMQVCWRNLPQVSVFVMYCVIYSQMVGT